MSWSMDLDTNFRGESKMQLCKTRAKTFPCMCHLQRLYGAGAPWVMQRVQATQSLWVTRWPSFLEEMLETDVLHRTLKALIRASQSFQNLTTLVRAPSLSTCFQNSIYSSDLIVGRTAKTTHTLQHAGDLHTNDVQLG